MSELDNHDNIKVLASKIKREPSSDVWNKISKKMESRKTNQKLVVRAKVRYWLSIAASVMVIITCVSIIYFESNQPQVAFQKGKLIDIQTLEVERDYFYSVENARKSVNSYLKLK